MPKEKTRILFPFVKLDLGSDRLLSFYSKFYQGNDNIDFREDNEFESVLQIVDYGKGRNSEFECIDINTGNRYPIFLSEIFRVIQNTSIEKGVVTGKWHFVKRGSNYSIALVEDN